MTDFHASLDRALQTAAPLPLGKRDDAAGTEVADLAHHLRPNQIADRCAPEQRPVGQPVRTPVRTGTQPSVAGSNRGGSILAPLSTAEWFLLVGMYALVLAVAGALVAGVVGT